MGSSNGYRVDGRLARRHPGQAGAIGGLSDTALAVVVGTLTLVGVVGFFQSSSSSAKTNSEIANLTALVANVRSAYYQAGSDYTNISAAALASAKIAPAPLVRAGGLRSMFGNSIAVASASSGGGSNDEFTVAYAALPPDACVKVVTMAWNTMSDIVSTTVNSSAPATLDISGATTSCSGAGNAVTFTFR